MQLTLEQASSMCDGELSSNSDASFIITNVVIDSREVIFGSLFIAIIGESNDGHRYVYDTLSKYKCAAIVNQTSNLDFPNLIKVNDTTKAIGQLASKYRDMFDIPIVAITGSNGKTTIKEMFYQVCKVEYGEKKVLASKNSFNNQWGMPLTLLQLNSEHEVAILEMGMNHHGELDYLTRIAKPTIAVVNNVLLSHAGFFKGLEDIAKAKGEIYNGLVAGGVALINNNIPYSNIWQENLKQQNVKIVNFGDETSGIYLKEYNDVGDTIISTPDRDIKLHLQVIGYHNQQNAITVTALALQLGCSTVSIVKGLESFTAYKHRLEQRRCFNGALIIDDSYNANPDSVKAAILAIKNLPKPHWLILGDLAELGDYSSDQHMEIGKFAYENEIDMLLTIGELTFISGNAYIAEKLENLEQIQWTHYNSHDEIVKYCKDNLPSNATLLIKGSNSMKLWQIADNLV
ncbi:MAG: UDP-N-acetylmuramoyl-tripeptide--D-alanyl-D-alanine ligase [Neisseriaceae bacterium]